MMMSQSLLGSFSSFSFFRSGIAITVLSRTSGVNGFFVGSLCSIEGTLASGFAAFLELLRWGFALVFEPWLSA
jgi:hypothetical protein